MSKEMEPKLFEQMVNEADINKDGKINYKDFVNTLMKQSRTARRGYESPSPTRDIPSAEVDRAIQQI